MVCDGEAGVLAGWSMKSERFIENSREDVDSKRPMRAAGRGSITLRLGSRNIFDALQAREAVSYYDLENK